MDVVEQGQKIPINAPKSFMYVIRHRQRMPAKAPRRKRGKKKKTGWKIRRRRRKRVQPFKPTYYKKRAFEGKVQEKRDRLALVVALVIIAPALLGVAYITNQSPILEKTTGPLYDEIDTEIIEQDQVHFQSPIWEPDTKTETSSTPSKKPDSPGTTFILGGTVTVDRRPMPNALVVISEQKIKTVEDFEIMTRSGGEFIATSTSSSGNFEFKYLKYNISYWMMVGAVFHKPAFKTVQMTPEDEPTVHFILIRKTLGWGVDDMISRGDGPYLVDLLRDEGPFKKYGLGHALEGLDLIAVVTWDNDMRKGGDLEIGYVTSCYRNSVDDEKQYPSQENNSETLVVHIDKGMIQAIQECSNEPQLQVFLDYVTWARDCYFIVTISIE